MRGMGIGSSVLLVALAVVLAVIGIRSIPDVRRYLEMRRM